MRDMTGTECVSFAIELSDLDGGNEMEIFVHEVMEVSESNEGLLHFEVEAALEDALALGSLEGIYLKE